MEDQSNQENPGRTTSGVSHHQFPIPKVAIAASSGRNGSHRTCLPKLTHHNYVEYLSESSTYNLPKTSTEFMMKSSYLPVGNISDGYGVSGTDRNFFYSDDPGKACSFKTIGSSSNDLDISKVGFWRADEGIKVETESSQNLVYAEVRSSHASWTSDSVGDKHNASHDPMFMVGAPTLLPKPGCSSSKQKARVTERQRRQRIADNLKALHELLPNPAEGSQAYVLDDIIDYVKYLQLQIKGYGHYINQKMLNEPLEEIMGKLVEDDSAAAVQLLESKGLFLLPMALVDELSEAVQMFGGSALV
ncbi:Transcription factor bHLH69 [Glycine max]|nr:Transcription factor bHLH69 [Glycine max]